jgi:polyhydroxyalkanoate synthesis repressor PhaR
MIVRKYSNRRLYDTEGSRYITLEEIAQKIRAGVDVRVLDAKSGEDLTQATLTQIILESRGAARLLPVPLLVQLIRLGDEALAEFLGRYLSYSLEMYLQAKQQAQAVAQVNPFAQLPFAATNAFARWFSGGEPPAADASDVASLRRELDELKREMRKKRK